jgi:hypothetical protein
MGGRYTSRATEARRVNLLWESMPMNRIDIPAGTARTQFRENNTLGFSLPNQPDRYRMPRVQVQIPLFVYGHISRNTPFHEEARTIAIDARGGLICMQTIVEPGQRLFVTNEANEQMQECAVVFADLQMGSGIAVEIEFPIPTSQFWHDLEIGKTFQS